MAEKAKPGRLDHLLAAVCRNCLVCRHARRRGEGLAYGFVRRIEKGVCPFCQAYERVYGVPAHGKRAAAP